MFESLSQNAPAVDGRPERTSPAPTFRIMLDHDRPSWLGLVPAHNAEPGTKDAIWSVSINGEAVRSKFIQRLEEAPNLLCLWGRIATFLGAEALGPAVTKMINEEEVRLREAEERAAEQERARKQVDSYIGDEKHAFTISLRRASEQDDAWIISFRGRAERERLRDWMRWQSKRYLEFLEYAETNGSAALERRLVDEMFETETRVKKAGKAAGGLRPLRMWRGDA